MKKVRVCVLLAMVMACLMATTAIAARSLQKGDVTLRLPSGADLIRITPTPAPARDPAAICKSKGHDWKPYTVTAPTCTDKGQRTQKCSVCGKLKTEELSATGHSFSEWKEVSRSKLERKCSRCGKTETKANPNGSLPSGVVAVKQTPTPRPYMGHEASKVTPTPKPQIVGKVTSP